MTVTVANHDQLRQQRVQQIEVKRTSKVQRIRSHPKGAKLDQTIQSSSNANLSSRMSVSPPSQNVLTSSSNRAFKCKVKSGTKRRSPSSSSHLQHRSTIATVTATHQRPTTVNSSSPNSPSTSPMNLSRSTSPAASIANFIRPISPPYIHVKEPLSPKFARASSTTATNLSSVQQCAPTTTTTTTTEPVSSSVVESCFEPEAYRNLSPLNSNQQKKLSFSDPTLNQTTKVSRHLPQSPIEPEEHLSISSLQQRLTPDDDDDDDDAHSDDETENPSSDDEPLPKAKASTNIRQSRKVIAFLSLIERPYTRDLLCLLALHQSSPSHDDLHQWHDWFVAETLVGTECHWHWDFHRHISLRHAEPSSVSLRWRSQT